MAGGYPIYVNGGMVRTSEALYQTFRFPHNHGIQQEILDCKSPMSAKMVSKKYREHTRSDWDEVRVHAMWWCLLAKMHTHRYKFESLLQSTGEDPIVELSRKDPFWGAKAQPDGTLRGSNVLGRLLMELRKIVDLDMWGLPLEPPGDSVPNALFLGRDIQAIHR